MGKVFSFELQGMNELQQTMSRASNQNLVNQAIATGIYEEANVIFAKSQVLVPVDTGALRGSGGVSAVQGQGMSAFVDIFYGGPAADYALWVHEILYYHHNAPTQAKYLEQPFMQAFDSIQKNLASRIISLIQGKV